MSYLVKEIFYSIQGEGAHSGRPAIFCRFAGCNLWSGREEDRGQAQCQFCDTDFRGTDGVGGGQFSSAAKLVEAVLSLWPSERNSAPPFVVLTGGEPTLQLDDDLIQSLHEAGCEIAIETNGTLPLPADLDWVCVSPKAGTSLATRTGDELKLIYPQPDLDPATLIELDFSHRYLQPMDGPRLEQNTKATMDYCLAHPEWKLSLQTHKILGVL